MNENGENSSGKKGQDEEEFPRPWSHKILVRQSSDVPGETIASCTCGEYSRAYPRNSDMLIMAQHGADHQDKHPMRPLSIVQLTDSEYLLVLAVPGTRGIKLDGEEGVGTVHMTVAVPAAIYEDGKALDKFLGPIGSPFHFRMAEERNSGRPLGLPVELQFDSVNVVEMPGVQDVINFLRDQKRQGDTGGVGFFLPEEGSGPEMPETDTPEVPTDEERLYTRHGAEFE